MDDQIAFGKNIRAARDSANSSREVVAERAEITAEYLGEVERGEKWPTLKVISSIARAIGVSPEVFFNFDNHEAGAPLEQVQQALAKRTAEQQKQALRVIKAMFGS
jgi:transcriptional regulator with XRE-family HTH domain